jgi:hypothetical protein
MRQTNAADEVARCGRGPDAIWRRKAEVKAASSRRRRKTARMLAAVVEDDPVGFVPRRIRRHRSGF